MAEFRCTPQLFLPAATFSWVQTFAENRISAGLQGEVQTHSPVERRVETARPLVHCPSSSNTRPTSGIFPPMGTSRTWLSVQLQKRSTGIKLGSFGSNVAVLGMLRLWRNRAADLAEQRPVVGWQRPGQLHGLQPSSLNPQKPGRHRLQSAPPTPDLQRQWPLLGWHQALPPVPGRGGKDPRGSHRQPARHNGDLKLHT